MRWLASTSAKGAGMPYWRATRDSLGREAAAVGDHCGRLARRGGPSGRAGRQDFAPTESVGVGEVEDGAGRGLRALALAGIPSNIAMRCFAGTHIGGVTP